MEGGEEGCPTDFSVGNNHAFGVHKWYVWQRQNRACADDAKLQRTMKDKISCKKYRDLSRL